MYYYCIIFPFINHCACGWVKKMMVELIMIYKIWHVNDSYFVVSQDITSTFPSRLENFFSPINFWVETTILYKMLTWSINILLYLCEKDMPWKFGTIYYLGLTLLFGDLAKVRCTYYWHIYFCWSKSLHSIYILQENIYFCYTVLSQQKYVIPIILTNFLYAIKCKY